MSSFSEAETISRSPSLSISATKTDVAPSAPVDMVVAENEGSAAPLFSYQAILSSLCEADIISKSPSLSMSATKTDFAPSALVEIVVVENEGSEAPLFSYQAILSSSYEADMISKSPSLSISANVTS